jgi:predicted nucleic acid-binding protein
MIVVDTNVLVPLWIATDASGKSERLLAADRDWCAPVLWRSEFRNVMVLSIRRRQISSDTAVEIIASAERLMGDREYRVESDAVIRRAVASDCSAYDCEFVVLAERLGVPLVTRDQQVLAAFPQTAMSPDDFLARHA